MTPDQQHPGFAPRTATAAEHGTPMQQLRARPSFEQASAGYVTMLLEMRAALTALVPDLHWVSSVPKVSGGSLCDVPFSKIDGAGTVSYTDHAEGAIPEAQWPQAWQQVITIAAKHGFTATQVLDVPTPSPTTGGPPSRTHVAYIGDAWDGNFEIQTQIDTVLGIDSPCLLHEAADPPATAS